MCVKSGEETTLFTEQHKINNYTHVEAERLYNNRKYL